MRVFLKQYLKWVVLVLLYTAMYTANTIGLMEHSLKSHWLPKHSDYVWKCIFQNTQINAHLKFSTVVLQCQKTFQTYELPKLTLLSEIFYFFHTKTSTHFQHGKAQQGIKELRVFHSFIPLILLAAPSLAFHREKYIVFILKLTVSPQFFNHLF